MTPFRFIKLHDRNGRTEVLVNVEQIVYIRDLRSDPTVQKIEDFHWTAVKTTTNYVLEVLETEEEIVAKIAMLQ